MDAKQTGQLENDLLVGRDFRVWDYSVSLSRLLIRSPRGNDIQSNVDIIFWGVRNMNITILLGEISISVQKGADETYQTYVIQSSKRSYTIEAVSYTVNQSDMDYTESPLDKL